MINSKPERSKSMVYLDNAATTGIKPDCVKDAVVNSVQGVSVNAGRGSYSAAREAVNMIDECRHGLLSIAKITYGYHVYFAPSATIAFNQIISSLPLDNYSTVYLSPFEHNASVRPICAAAQKVGAKVEILPFDPMTWSFEAAQAEDMFLENKPDYVIVSHVSNTTGYILPIKEITDLAHQYGAKVIVDCAQAMGAIDANYADIGADAYVFAGHKTLYATYGIAGFVLADSWNLVPTTITGGTGSDSLNTDIPLPENGGFEPGSININAVFGLHAALSWMKKTTVAEIQEKEKELVAYFVEKAKKISKVRLYIPTKDHSSIIALNVEGYESHDVGEILDDEFGICVRTGYQCAPYVHDWLNTKEFAGVVRVSFSYFTTESDIDAIINALKTL